MSDRCRPRCVRIWVGALAALLLVADGPARAQQREEEARAAYAEGKLAYEAKRYDAALEHFKRSYTLSGQPALLYNIASTQQQLNQPGLAAGTLRDFLKARPNDPDRAELETRIASLQQSQRLIDREADEKRRLIEQSERERAHARTLLDAPGWLSEAEADRRLALVKERERKRRRALAIGLGVGLGALVVGAVTVGALCGTGHCGGSAAHDFDFAPVSVTR